MKRAVIAVLLVAVLLLYGCAKSVPAVSPQDNSADVQVDMSVDDAAADESDLAVEDPGISETELQDLDM